MSGKVKMSGHSYGYLCRAEKTALDGKVRDVYNAVNALCNACTHVQLHHSAWAGDFDEAQKWLTMLYKEMLDDRRYVYYVGRAEYDAGVKALADGKTRMEGAKNRGDEEQH
jgi:hypothetical protein